MIRILSFHQPKDATNNVTTVSHDNRFKTVKEANEYLKKAAGSKDYRDFRKILSKESDLKQSDFQKVSEFFMYQHIDDKMIEIGEGNTIGKKLTTDFGMRI
ncbi:hypothetical protein [Alkalihalobacillus sp. AL-G]|uniref:hypothetical protein n=1 Tax=Alkalihalobacillus sp. AL-G TaxID=2926399 RepID=UPI00272AC291|nr:hypothetical protein [Alkalihalobacillus sp. AL-G]WLD94783.1 hypothetical protein MOJ78_07840 [Alkalihalobacillus sp. AL-G]